MAAKSSIQPSDPCRKKRCRLPMAQRKPNHRPVFRDDDLSRLGVSYDDFEFVVLLGAGHHPQPQKPARLFRVFISNFDQFFKRVFSPPWPQDTANRRNG